MRTKIWTVLGWTLFAGTLAWALVTGGWMLGVVQKATDLWIGEPWAIPFLPYVSSDFILGPLAPFHALLARGDWLPFASMLICGWGSVALWYTAGFCFAMAGAHPGEKQPERPGQDL